MGKMTMPAVSTTPPTTISLAAIVLAVSRHVTKSAAHATNRQLMAFDNTLALMKRAVVLLSGGVDSTTTLAVARERGFETYALTFRYGQRHAAEDALGQRAELGAQRGHPRIEAGGHFRGRQRVGRHGPASPLRRW